METKFFRAYATTTSNNGPRVPIDAERIVIVLGKDEKGRPLEIWAICRCHMAPLALTYSIPPSG